MQHDQDQMFRPSEQGAQHFEHDQQHDGGSSPVFDNRTDHFQTGLAPAHQGPDAELDNRSGERQVQGPDASTQWPNTNFDGGNFGTGDFAHGHDGQHAGNGIAGATERNRDLVQGPEIAFAEVDSSAPITPQLNADVPANIWVDSSSAAPNSVTTWPQTDPQFDGSASGHPRPQHLGDQVAGALVTDQQLAPVRPGDLAQTGQQEAAVIDLAEGGLTGAVDGPDSGAWRAPAQAPQFGEADDGMLGQGLGPAPEAGGRSLHGDEPDNAGSDPVEAAPEQASTAAGSDAGTPYPSTASGHQQGLFNATDNASTPAGHDGGNGAVWSGQEPPDGDGFVAAEQRELDGMSTEPRNWNPDEGPERLPSGVDLYQQPAMAAASDEGGVDVKPEPRHDERPSTGIVLAGAHHVPTLPEAADVVAQRNAVGESPARSAKTEQFYAGRVALLFARCSELRTVDPQLPANVTPLDVVEDLISGAVAQAAKSPQTWNLYRAALLWHLAQNRSAAPEYEEAYQRLAVTKRRSAGPGPASGSETAQGRKAARNSTSKKAIPEKDLDELLAILGAMNRTTNWGSRTQFWLMGALAAGARPGEWPGASWLDESKQILCIPNLKRKRTGPVFLVAPGRSIHDVEAENPAAIPKGAAFDESKRIRNVEIRESDRLWVDLHLDALNAYLDAHPDRDREKSFTAYFNVCRKVLREACIRAFGNKKRYSLYVMRSQYAANRKAEIPLTEVAERMGHTADARTTMRSYAGMKDAHGRGQGDADRNADRTRDRQAVGSQVRQQAEAAVADLRQDEG